MVDILHFANEFSTASGLPAANDYIAIAPRAIVNDFRVARTQGVIHVAPSDLAADQALAAYLCDGDYTGAETEAGIEANLTDPGDRPTVDLSNRLAMPLLDGQGNPVFISAAQPTGVFNMKVNKTFKEDKGWTLGFYGMGAAPAGNMDVTILEKAYGVWVN